MIPFLLGSLSATFVIFIWLGVRESRREQEWRDLLHAARAKADRDGYARGWEKAIATVKEHLKRP